MRRASVTGSQKACKQRPSASEPLLRLARSTGRLAEPQGAEGRGARDRPGRRDAAALPGRSALRRGAALVLRRFLDQGARRVRGGGRARPRGGSMTEQVAGATVRREVTVQAPVERAFSVFTEGIATWWPHEETHNVGPTPADAVMEPFEGGRCYAKAYDGTETDWGRVMTWDPPEPRRVRVAPEPAVGVRAGSLEGQRGRGALRGRRLGRDARRARAPRLRVLRRRRRRDARPGRQAGRLDRADGDVCGRLRGGRRVKYVLLYE